MDVQILTVSMHQNDFSLVDKMNIRTNAIIANQTSYCCFNEKEYNFGTVKMISTNTRGVGLNRNIALLAAEADILVFSDDDMQYYDGTLERVKTAFLNNPKADVIIFSLDITKNGQIVRRKYNKNKRAHLWNSMKYGTCAIAVRRKSLIKANMKFNELFGGGCPFSSGEDSLFIKDCFKNHLKVYTDSYVLGACSKDSSSWFCGYNEKYLYDKGVLLNFLFPKLKYLMAVYYACRLRTRTQLSIYKNFKLMCKGITNAEHLDQYNAAFDSKSSVKY